MRCSINKYKSKKAFTLVDVMITLAVIGFIAMIVIPWFLDWHRQMVLRSRFKVTYSMLQNAWSDVAISNGIQTECYYWNRNPYGDSVCTSYDANGACVTAVFGNGTPVPADYSGKFNDCVSMKAQLQKAINVSKTCSSNAVSLGCIPDYAGVDTVYKAANPSVSADFIKRQTGSCWKWRKDEIAKNREAWVLSNGVIILWYEGPDLFAVDVNGKQPPNKWGYDLFPFVTQSDQNQPLLLTPGGCEYPEEGGMAAAEMVHAIYK